MKYLIILYVTYKDQQTKSKSAIYTYDTEDDALQNFYKYMGQYVNAEGVSSVLVEAINSIGGIYKNESWIAQVEEVTE